MRFCCCFCGKAIEALPSYRLQIQKNSDENGEKTPAQELYCHEQCLEESLHNADLLYLKHL